MIEAGASLADAIRGIAARLSGAGIEDARLDARLLVEAATGVSPEQLVLDPARPLCAEQACRLEAFVERRLAREPLTRILGERFFYGRAFEVTAATLDPRPDTETVVDLALSIAAEEGWRDRRIELLDVGTGTGCLLLSLIAELPRAHGLGTDLSPAAIEVARRNASRLELADRARFQVARSFEGIAGSFDLVVSNPPYIPTDEIAGLDPEVRCFDPHLALDGGADGLDIVRQIVEVSANRRPVARGWFIVEIGAGQARALVELIATLCGPQVALASRRGVDFGGHVRCVAWKPQI